MTREEKLKLLLDTGEYDFIKNIPQKNMWKLIFALAYIEDTIPMSDIDSIKAEIKTEKLWMKRPYMKPVFKKIIFLYIISFSVLNYKYFP